MAHLDAIEGARQGRGPNHLVTGPWPSTVPSSRWANKTVRGSYADSKLLVTTLAAAVARLRPGVLSNAVDRGWVPTTMGGPSAPDDLELGRRTQEWLAASDDPEALTAAGYWYRRRQQQPHRAIHDEAFQGRLLRTLAKETDTAL
ncbi:hypothetical protein ACFQ10_48750 [Streptomyces indonesiensis]